MHKVNLAEAIWRALCDAQDLDTDDEYEPIGEPLTGDPGLVLAYGVPDYDL